MSKHTTRKTTALAKAETRRRNEVRRIKGNGHR